MKQALLLVTLVSSVRGFFSGPVHYSIVPRHLRSNPIHRPCRRAGNTPLRLSSIASEGVGVDQLYHPPSQIESLVANAKGLMSEEKKDDVDASSSSGNLSKFLTASAAGLAVAMPVFPAAVAFSFVAGVDPLAGLWTTVILGFVAAALGGRAGICSSSSGACSVVVTSLCLSHGPAYLAACAVLTGILQLAGGVMGMGKFIRLVPHPVMLGFVNGLAIGIFKKQLAYFEGCGASMYGVTALTMVFVKLFPRLTKAIPPSLGAIVLSTLCCKIFKIPVTTLADVSGPSTFAGGLAVLPKIGLPKVPWSLTTLKVVFPYALTMAAVGLIESLLTMQLIDGIMDDGKWGSTRKECVAQGAGNFLSGLVGGIGGCALVGHSLVNVQSGGGVSRWSGMSMPLFLALGIVFAAPLFGAVPVAALVAVMLLVCESQFSWSSLRILRKIPRLDALTIAVVSYVTVTHDLAVAVVAGTMMSAIGFAWEQSTSLFASISKSDEKEKVYNLHGPLFFGSSSRFSRLFQVKDDPQDVILDFTNSRVYDHSALEAITALANQYGDAGKTVHLRHLSNDCAILLSRMYEGGKLPPWEVIEKDPETDPVYGVFEDYTTTRSF